MATEPVPVVFVHGAGNTSAVWRHQVACLGGRYRPLAIDLPGNGVAKATPEPSMDCYADAVERCADEHGARRPVLVGHSHGGAVILVVALRDPGAYRGLVLVGTAARNRAAPAFLEQAPGDFETRLDIIGGLASGSPAAPALQAEFRREAEAAGPDSLRCNLLSWSNFDVRHRLPELNMPALAIVGDQDRLMPLKHSQYLQQHLPRCQLAVIPDAGHWVQLEQPAAFNGALGTFLSPIV